MKPALVCTCPPEREVRKMSGLFEVVEANIRKDPASGLYGVSPLDAALTPGRPDDRYDFTKDLVNFTPRMDNAMKELNRAVEMGMFGAYCPVHNPPPSRWQVLKNRVRSWIDDRRERLAGWIWPYCTCEHDDDY